jgi:hypothetical protein
MKRLATLVGAFLFTFAPLQAKSTCKPEIRYSKFYNHPAYMQGFDDGYDGLEYCNPYSYYDDRMLYDIGFENGDQAYLDDNLRYRSKRYCF